MAKSPILGGFSTQRSPNAASNLAVNLGVEIIVTKDGKVPGFLFGMSGLDRLFTIGSGPGRGGLPLNDVFYAVSGNQVYSLTANGVLTLCGEITIGTNLVSMFQNTRQLMIVDGVGAWIVPGGFPLVSGTISTPSIGELYAVGDTIVLQAASGFQSVFPEVTVTTISNNPVTTFTTPNTGSGYTSATGVATTPIQGQPGGGTGLTLDTTAAGGPITAAAINVGGIGYATGDTGVINGGSGDAVYQITSQAGGVATGVRLLNPGLAYASATGATTTSAPGVPPNIGINFTVNITAAGAISAAVVDMPGQGFVPGAVGAISGGGGDATYLITTVGATSAVTGFTVTRGGAITDEALSFTQKSTSGSGEGFVLSSPSYGAFVGLVPIELPFPNPVKGVVSDGFGVMVFLNNQSIAASDELDLSTWQPLSFGVADQSPDYCVGIELLHDEVYLLKEKNSEVWVDQGLANFPFGPLQGVHIEYGTTAPFSSAKVDNDMIWLSRNDQGQGIFVEVSAYTPKPISTQALTTVLQTYPNLGDCIAYARQEGGHTYYVATFPEANATWVYDKTSSDQAGFPIWTQLAALDNGDLNRHWGNYFTPWTGTQQATTTTTGYQPQSVTFKPAQLITDADLVGLPASFSTALLSVWLDLPDTTGVTGMNFGDQSGGVTPGLQIQVQNDQTGSPQITISAWDASSNPIVVATYDFSTWAAWVNLLISIDTATNQLQVYANTITAGVFAETLLSPASITWSSTNPIAPAADQPWHLTAV